MPGKHLEQCLAHSLSPLLLANIYFECLIWAKRWALISLFIVQLSFL